MKLPLVIAAIGSIALIGSGAAGEETASAPSQDSAELIQGAADADAAKPALQAGRVVHVDPKSGLKVLPSPAQRAAGQAHMRSMLNRSSVGLIETASPASGVMVNLQGRFRHATALILDAEGESASMCSASPTPLDEEASHE